MPGFISERAFAEREKDRWDANNTEPDDEDQEEEPEEDPIDRLYEDEPVDAVVVRNLSGHVQVLGVDTDGRTWPRGFILLRSVDHTGVSGTGVVAHGVQFYDDTVVLRWLGEHASTVVWKSLDDALAIHGHGGATQVVWL